MQEIKIKILDQEYKLKQSFRALILFEEMTGKGSDDLKDTMTDMSKMLWCFLKGSNRETFTYSYDELLDIMDDHPEMFEDFANYLKSLNPNRGTNRTPPKKKRIK